jgi:type II secretory pathway component PulF
MPQYAYMARDGMGKRVTGSQIAEGEDQLTRMLREMDLYLVSASPRSRKSP